MARTNLEEQSNLTTNRDLGILIISLHINDLHKYQDLTGFSVTN